MDIIQIILSFIIGCIVVVLIGLIFSLKTKGIVRLLINSLLGIIVIAILNFTNVLPLPINPFNALVIGILGSPGIIVIYFIMNYI